MEKLRFTGILAHPKIGSNQNLFGMANSIYIHLRLKKNPFTQLELLTLNMYGLFHQTKYKLIFYNFEFLVDYFM